MNNKNTTSKSPMLDHVLENQECKIPDGKIRSLYDALADPSNPDVENLRQTEFRTYCTTRLNRDPWAKEIIEEEITTNYKVEKIFDLSEKTARISSLEKMKAANDDNYSEAA